MRMRACFSKRQCLRTCVTACPHTHTHTFTYTPASVIVMFSCLSRAFVVMFSWLSPAFVSSCDMAVVGGSGIGRFC